MINVSDAYQAFRYNFDIPEGVDSGVIVASIVSGTGAANSDLQEGDIITKINDQEVENSAYLRYELYKYSVGDTITVTYNRNGEERTTQVTLTRSE